MVYKRFGSCTRRKSGEDGSEGIQLRLLVFQSSAYLAAESGQAIKGIEAEWTERNVCLVSQIDGSAARIEYADCRKSI